MFLRVVTSVAFAVYFLYIYVKHFLTSVIDEIEKKDEIMTSSYDDRDHNYEKCLMSCITGDVISF